MRKESGKDDWMNECEAYETSDSWVVRKVLKRSRLELLLYRKTLYTAKAATKEEDRT